MKKRRWGTSRLAAQRGEGEGRGSVQGGPAEGAGLHLHFGARDRHRVRQPGGAVHVSEAGDLLGPASREERAQPRQGVQGRPDDRLGGRHPRVVSQHLVRRARKNRAHEALCQFPRCTRSSDGRISDGFRDHGVRPDAGGGEEGGAIQGPPGGDLQPHRWATCQSSGR